jgi:hypothetical protein
MTKEPIEQLDRVLGHLEEGLAEAVPAAHLRELPLQIVVTASMGETVDAEIALRRRVSRLSTQSEHNQLSILKLAITRYENTASVPFLSLAVVVIKRHDSAPKQAGLYLMAPLFALRNRNRGLPSVYF